MFQPQATPYSPFASYGVSGLNLNPNSNSNSAVEYNFQAPALPLDSGGPTLFDTPTFRFNPAGSLNINTPQPRYLNHNTMENTPPPDDLEAQEAMARQYQPDLKGPLVGDRKSSHAITEEYVKGDPIYVAKTSALPQTYSHYRPVLGDGNCGWRAIGFSYFETLQRLGDKHQVDGEVARMMSLTNFLTTMGGHAEWMFEDMRDEVLALLRDIATTIHLGPQSDSTSLILQRFNDPEKSDCMVYYFRLLASSWLRANATTYEAFIPDGIGVDGYCKETLELPNMEIEHLGMTLLIDVLLKPVGFAVEIVYLDRSEGTQVNTHLIQAEDANGIPTNPSSPIIYLLYRPGHYDILYKDSSSLSNTLRQQQIIDTAATHSNIQVNRVSSLSQHHAITATAHGNFNSLDLSLIDSFPSFSLSTMGTPSDFSLPFTAVVDYDNASVPSAPCGIYSSNCTDMDNVAASPVSPLPSAVVTDFHPSGGLPIHPQSISGRQFRPSKYEYESDWNDNPTQTLKTSTFKNSHYNTAHYNNPNFQPEEWSPDCDDGGSGSGSRVRQKST